MTGRGVALGALGVSVAALVGLSLSSAESRCQRDQDAYQAQTRERPSAPEINQFRTDRAGLPCLLESAVGNPETEQTDQNETRDLMAQEASALWGYWLLVIAALQLVATIVGLVFIKRTLDATWKAVEDTSEATEAMRESNRIARDTAQRQLRAYVVVTGFAGTPFEGGKIPSFKIAVENGGQTHARGLHLIAQPFWYRPKDGEPPIRFKRDPGGPRSKMTLGAKQPYIFDDPLLGPLTNGQADALQRGEIGLIYAGIFIYRDIFGRRRMTSFKTRYDYGATGEQKFSICLRGNVTG